MTKFHAYKKWLLSKFLLNIAKIWIHNFEWTTFWLALSDGVEDTITIKEWEVLGL